MGFVPLMLNAVAESVYTVERPVPVSADPERTGCRSYIAPRIDQIRIDQVRSCAGLVSYQIMPYVGVGRGLRERAETPRQERTPASAGIENRISEPPDSECQIDKPD